MPEHTLPDALHPQQEDAADELQLRGGLKGRFFADFCLLQSTVDALQNYLVHAATPDVQDMAAPLLEEMKQRIFRLERLADNAADLVAQSQPPRQLNWTVQEMTVYLAQLCDAANHELEECAVTGRVHLQPMPQNQPVWAQIDLAIVQTMFANLFSNSLRANPAAKITITAPDARWNTTTAGSGRRPPAPSWLVFRHRKPLPTDAPVCCWYTAVPKIWAGGWKPQQTRKPCCA